jgi:hypothetical protein
MNVAMELAKQHLTDIRGALVKEGLRGEDDEAESPGVGEKLLSTPQRSSGTTAG